jgi:hypothetical protein
VFPSDETVRSLGRQTFSCESELQTFFEDNILPLLGLRLVCSSGRLGHRVGSHDALKVNPFIPIVLLWIGAFIRDRSIFF